jgi:hypothetical protein
MPVTRRSTADQRGLVQASSHTWQDDRSSETVLEMM